jgi:hypothetical protein
MEPHHPRKPQGPQASVAIATAECQQRQQRHYKARNTCASFRGHHRCPTLCSILQRSVRNPTDLAAQYDYTTMRTAVRGALYSARSSDWVLDHMIERVLTSTPSHKASAELPRSRIYLLRCALRRCSRCCPTCFVHSRAGRLQSCTCRWPGRRAGLQVLWGSAQGR